MQRRMIVGLAVGGSLLLGFGLMVWAGTQGLFSPQSKPRRLMAIIDRELEQGQLGQAQAKLSEVVSKFPDSPVSDEALFKLGQLQEQQHQMLEARAAYLTLLDRAPTSPFASKAREQLGNINVALLMAPTTTDQDLVYTVQPGETLGGIAQRQGTTVELIRRINQLPNDTIRAGQRLKLSQGRFSIAVDKSDNVLILNRDSQFFKLYHVSTGANNSTPAGTFKVVNKIVNPVWYKQGAAVPPDSPDNILGTRWLGWDKPGFGIHGTVDPDAIGQQVTAGCVRMRNAEVEELFALVPIGTEITVTD